MPFENAAMLSQLPPGGLCEVVLSGRPIALCNIDGRIHAMDGVCPHRNGPLGQGALHGTKVVCPWHAWEFDCVTGEHDYNPSIRLATFPVKVEDGEILVDCGV